MVIYEVNLLINKNIINEYQPWLKQHVLEMLELPGFLNAMILKPELKDSSEQVALTVHYQLKSRANLENYFTQFATEMRAQSKQLFGDQFSAERRILEVDTVFNAIARASASSG